MDYQAIDTVRARHPAWRLLRASNATLILSFLGEFFVEDNRGACAAGAVADALDDRLYALNAEDVRYPTAISSCPAPRGSCCRLAVGRVAVARRDQPPLVVAGSFEVGCFGSPGRRGPAPVDCCLCPPCCDKSVAALRKCDRADFLVGFPPPRYIRGADDGSSTRHRKIHPREQ